MVQFQHEYKYALQNQNFIHFSCIIALCISLLYAAKRLNQMHIYVINKINNS